MFKKELLPQPGKLNLYVLGGKEGCYPTRDQKNSIEMVKREATPKELQTVILDFMKDVQDSLREDEELWAFVQKFNKGKITSLSFPLKKVSEEDFAPILKSLLKQLKKAAKREKLKKET